MLPISFRLFLDFPLETYEDPPVVGRIVSM
jgi:hypothetical protein